MMLEIDRRPMRLGVLLAVAMAVAALLSPNTVYAELFIYEGFDYTVGEELQGKAGGTGLVSDSWDMGTEFRTTSPVMAAGSLEYTDSQGNQLQTSGNYASFAPPDPFIGTFSRGTGIRKIDMTSVPASLKVNVDGTDKLGKDGTSVWLSFMHQSLNTQGAWGGVSLYDGEFISGNNMLDIGEKDTEAPFNKSLGFAGSLADPLTAQSDVPQETLSLLVLRIDFNELVEDDINDPTVPINGPDPIAGEDQLYMWVNPDLNQIPDDNNAVYLPFRYGGGLPTFTFDGFRIQKGYGPTGTEGPTFMDELRVGETFADVTPYVAAATPGDFDGDGDVDGNDFLVWQRDMSVGNLADWEDNFGAVSLASVATVPEPASGLLACWMAMAFGLRRRSARSINPTALSYNHGYHG